MTASTASDEPRHQAATRCRKRGRIVLVGVVGLELNRADFYEKELSFQVSCSYGPGRYDRAYEEDGHDYPVGREIVGDSGLYALVASVIIARYLGLGEEVIERFLAE